MPSHVYRADFAKVDLVQLAPFKGIEPMTKTTKTTKKDGKKEKGTVVPFKGSSSTYKPCYEAHPPLPLPGGREIYGGSCSTPVVKDAHLYVGLDEGMKFTTRIWPWMPGHEVYYPITDMSVPADPVSFTDMIDFVHSRIEAGEKVHVGCIGGHGRTGMVFAALVGRHYGEKDAIAYVRKHYCSKAVETASQVAFLVKHFGVKTAAPSKTDWGTSFSGHGNWSPKGGATSYTTTKATERLTPVLNKLYVFGEGAWTQPT